MFLREGTAAQWVRTLTSNTEVPGSIPAESSLRSSHGVVQKTQDDDKEQPYKVYYIRNAVLVMYK